MNANLFENKFVRDKSAAKELYGFWFLKRPIMLFIHIAMAVCIFFYIITICSGILSFSELSFPIFLIIFYWVLLFVSYLSQVSTMVKRDSELANGGELLCEITVTDREITHISRGNTQSIGFDKVKYAFSTQNYVAVVTEAKYVYMIKKDGFTLGDSESFIAFLCGKGIKVRR